MRLGKLILGWVCVRLGSLSEEEGQISRFPSPLVSKHSALPWVSFYSRS